MVVFLGHSSGREFTGGFLWQLGQYQQTAVIVFFVLSGYVIAYVLNGRETTPGEYAKARIARLYSVVIPALLLTATCDAIGLRVDPSLYYDGPWGYPPSDETALRYFATLLFANQFWTAHLDPGINGPFWSLSYEVVYYILAGLAFFTKGWVRGVALVIVSLMAGPTIMALAPIWFMGFGLYHLTRGITISRTYGVLWSVIGLLMIVCGPLIRSQASDFSTLIHRPLLADYYDAIAFSLHLFGIHYVAGWFGVPKLVDRPVRWAASLTFALYLFHRPLIQLFAAIDIGPPDSWQQRLYLLGTTLLIVVTIGRWCEKQKGALRRGLDRLTQRRPAVS
jgi:peptidoglycan/LPS O-acetylase OafA/YrhL